jgi:hypothetical protein
MILVAVLDLTLDSVDKEDNQFANLVNCFDKQKEIFNNLIDVKTKAQKIETGRERDDYITDEIRKAQL